MNLIQSNVKTMTLKEITDLLDVQHSKAMLKVERMAKEPEFGTVSKMDSVYNDKGQTVETYILDKRQSVAVSSMLNTALLMRVIDRWEQLESKQEETPEQLMARALISAQSVIASKDAQIEAAQPAIRLESAISNDNSTLSMTESGKKLQVKPRKFIEWLYQHKYIDASNMPYQRWINQGLLVISTIEKNGKPRSSTRVTGKGFAYFGGKLSELKFNNQQHFLFYK